MLVFTLIVLGGIILVEFIISTKRYNPNAMGYYQRGVSGANKKIVLEMVTIYNAYNNFRNTPDPRYPQKQTYADWVDNVLRHEIAHAVVRKKIENSGWTEDMLPAIDFEFTTFDDAGNKVPAKLDRGLLVPMTEEEIIAYKAQSHNKEAFVTIETILRSLYAREDPLTGQEKPFFKIQQEATEKNRQRVLETLA